jgi:protoheme IX farnesyltransferase
MSAVGQMGAVIAPRRSTARIRDFTALTKPRVMSLVMFTAMVGYTVAPGRRDALTACIVLLGIAAGAGGAGALNMWYEADLDAAMTRTAGRPLPRGRVSRSEALAFGLALAAAGVAVLGLVNLAAASIAGLYGLLLCRHLHDVAEAPNAAEYCPRRCRWRIST